MGGNLPSSALSPAGQNRLIFSEQIASVRFGKPSLGVILALIERREDYNPVALIEAMASRNGWPLDGAGDEVALLVKGRCTNYQVFFTWMRELEVFHLACSFDAKVPEVRRSEVQQLIGRINEDLWLGHFDLWMEDGTILFRQSLLLLGGVTMSSRQCEVMLGLALDICEHYYPAFNFVFATGSAVGALDAIRGKGGVNFER